MNPCENCGQPVKRSSQRFCNRRCYGSWKLGRNARNEAVHEYLPTVDGKNVELSCEVCGEKFLVPHHAASGTRPIPRFCSSECFGKSRRSENFDEKHRKHDIEKWRQQLHWRSFRRAWIESHPACSSCGVIRRGRNLVVHHPVDPNPTRDEALLFAPSNLVVLCRSCHVKLHVPRSTPRARC